MSISDHNAEVLFDRIHTCEMRAKAAEAAKIDLAEHLDKTIAVAADAVSRAEAAEAELTHIDAILARRRALEDIPSRVDKILRTIDVASVCDTAEAQLSAAREALEQIDKWAKAYPLKVFPEPDFDKAAHVLKDAGMTLDAISASNMRHVLEGVQKIVAAAEVGPARGP